MGTLPKSPRNRTRSSHSEPSTTMAESLVQPALKNVQSVQDPTELYREESVYLDPKMSQAGMDDTYYPQVATNSTIIDANVTGDANSKRKRREDRQLRIAAEQIVWLRRKFSLSDSEQLVASFAAALSRTILYQGRMYITSEYICFYSRIFGKVTKECFSLQSVHHVKKRKGGLVANAIKFYFLEKSTTPIVIGSINQRERAFTLIQQRLAVLNPDAVTQPSNEEDASVGSVGSIHDDSEDPSFEGQDFDTVKNPSNHANHSPDGSSRNSADHTDRLAYRMRTQGRQAGDSDSSGSLSRQNSDIDQSHVSADLDSSLVWCTPDDVIGCVATKAYDKRSERARGILNAPVKVAFNVLYISDWVRHYHDAVNNRDVKITDWERGEGGFMTRELNFIRPIGYKIGPKETRVKEIQYYSFTEKGGVIVQVKGENLDAPYGSYFVVESFFELSPHGDGSQTLFVLSVAVNFLKSTILQGKIESGALSETKMTYKRLFDLASDRIDAYMAERCANRVATECLGKNRVSKRVNYDDSDEVHVVGNETQGSRDLGCTSEVTRNKAQPLVAEEACNRSAKKSQESDDDNDGQRAATHAQNSLQNSACAQPKMQASMEQDNSTTNVNNVIEVKDSNETRWLRIGALGILLIVCVLLLGVLVLLSRVHNRVRALELTVAESLKLLSDGTTQC